ncbi:glycosyltransferase family 2 protein [Candidatus Pacearchaeota archaeon]|nr:glycosyltransferase family 2 protein [Candidatus Pacearchaeota archaeon]
MKKDKVSVIITAFKEPKTIGKAITQIAKQKLANEIIVVAPDKETLLEAEKLKENFKEIILLKDPGEGKPVALNLAVKKAKGHILVLTDGDVYVSDNSLKHLIDKFQNKKVGAVSGHPVSINPKNKMLGYWGYVLSSIAHDLRTDSIKKEKRIFCSGYLFAIRKELFPKLAPEILSEDGYISHKVYEKKYVIEYSKESEVYVKYPDNFNDWIKQKKRSVGGYNQIKKLLGVNIRSFGQESSSFFKLFRYVNSVKEISFLFALFLARIYLWILIYLDINIRKKSHKDIWLRIESTK